MDIYEEKLALIEWIAGVEDEDTISTLAQIKATMSNGNGLNGHDDEMTDEERQGVMAGLAQAKAGRTRPFEEFQKEMQTWLTR